MPISVCSKLVLFIKFNRLVYYHNSLRLLTRFYVKCRLPNVCNNCFRVKPIRVYFVIFMKLANVLMWLKRITKMYINVFTV